MLPDTWTVLQLLNWTTTYFKTHHIDKPRPAAEILLAHTLELSRVDLYIQYDRPLNPGELATFKKAIQRRIRGEPVAYIVGEKGFWSLDLRVTREVLIPRPETEVVVETALSIIPEEPLPRPFRILDLGTGSGAIVLALASERPGHRFYALDYSQGALRVAGNNARRYGLDGEIGLFCGSWFDAVSYRGNGFDLIVSNPPYICRDELDKLAVEISDNEPRDALDGGTDGLEAIGIIVEHALKYMNTGGWLVFEIGCDQWDCVKSLIMETDAYTDLNVIKDYSGLNRVVQARVRG